MFSSFVLHRFSVFLLLILLLLLLFFLLIILPPPLLNRAVAVLVAVALVTNKHIGNPSTTA